MRLECEDVKSGHSSHLEKLDAEGARVKRLVEDYARHVGFDQDKRAAS
jgi:hypothetical protein